MNIRQLAPVVVTAGPPAALSAKHGQLGETPQFRTLKPIRIRHRFAIRKSRRCQRGPRVEV